ncbi:hypothetical protein AB0933_04465 [Streptomyces venezuelae]|uniref:hypothetical protein n=1 Tax=Streptomyces venezuelae TaxID=54571 RepID=UPI00345573B0
MGSDGPQPGPAPQDVTVCGACGGPVGTAIRRRKVLGVFVPVWGPGPCRNAECEACVVETDEKPGAGARRSRTRHGRRHAPPGDGGK